MAYKYPVGIIGAGAWGTALAEHLGTCCGHNVLLWSYDKKAAKDIRKNNENSVFLPNIDLSDNIDVTTSIEDITKHCEIIIYATPAHFCSEIACLIAPDIKEDQILVISSKGFREDDGALLSDVWLEKAPQLNKIAILAGPTFAEEVATKKPTTATIACEDTYTLGKIDALFSSTLFRLYYSKDIIGAQVGGAVKNVISIAAGISAGLGMGENFKAAILCRGVIEMMRYTRSIGGERITLAGLSGLGDLILSSHEGSRNYRFGYYLGQGKDVQQAERLVGSTVEGIKSAAILTMQGASHGIDMGIIMAIHSIINGDIDAKRTFYMLLDRPRVNEFNTEDELR